MREDIQKNGQEHAPEASHKRNYVPPTVVPLDIQVTQGGAGFVTDGTTWQFS